MTCLLFFQQLNLLPHQVSPLARLQVAEVEIDAERPNYITNLAELPVIFWRLNESRFER